MERIQLVANCSTLEAGEPVDPGAVIGELRVSSELAGLITSEGRAGRAVMLQVVIEERQNGAFIIAGSLGAVPVAPAKAAPKPNPAPAAVAPASKPAPPQGDNSETPAK